MAHHQVKPVSLPAAGTSGVVAAGPVLLFGWGVKENTGAGNASVDLFDGNDGTGQIAVPMNFNSSESVRDWLGPDGLLMERGVYLRNNSGQVAGSLWIAALPADVTDTEIAYQGEA